MGDQDCTQCPPNSFSLLYKQTCIFEGKREKPKQEKGSHEDVSGGKHVVRASIFEGKRDNVSLKVKGRSRSRPRALTKTSQEENMS